MKQYRTDVDGKWESDDGIAWALTEPSEEYLSRLNDEFPLVIAEPSLEERIQALEVMELERILGGGF